ncbi:hypothetical protein [Rhizobium sp. PAMB 3182]
MNGCNSLGGLSRRSFFASFCGALLASCQDGRASIRFRVIAKVFYEGAEYHASTVMECHYARIKNSLIGMGGSTTLYGEALIFDLPDGHTFYVLPYWLDKGHLNQLYERGLLTTFGIKSSLGGLTGNDLSRIKSLTGTKPFNYFGHLPAIVAFEDEQNPKSIFALEPDALGRVFPGVTYAGVDLQITTSPVTEKLRERLTWLNTPAGTQVFERDPPGQIRRASESPIGYNITKAKFFGDGSR